MASRLLPDAIEDEEEDENDDEDDDDVVGVEEEEGPVSDLDDFLTTTFSWSVFV